MTIEEKEIASFCVDIRDSNYSEIKLEPTEIIVAVGSAPYLLMRKFTVFSICEYKTVIENAVADMVSDFVRKYESSIKRYETPQYLDEVKRFTETKLKPHEFGWSKSSASIRKNINYAKKELSLIKYMSFKILLHYKGENAFFCIDRTDPKQRFLDGGNISQISNFDFEKSYEKLVETKNHVKSLLNMCSALAGYVD